MRQSAADSDTFSLFGKKMSKNKALDVLKKLAGGAEGDEEEADDSISPISLPKGKAAKAPKYNPNDLYGGFFSMYGGQKVRGGLLGE
jgi:hypothetical protein